MTNINLAVLTVILIFPLGAFSLAQETATTKDGRQVTLNPDGKWQYITNTTAATSSSAIQTLRLYLSATSLRDRIPFVMNQDKVEPLIKDRYRGKKWKVPVFEIATQKEPEPSQTGWVQIKADVSKIYGIRGMSEKTMTYYLRKTEEGYRIDWESSEGFNPFTETEFIATMPTRPIRFRVLARLTDHYNYEFAKLRESAYSIDINTGDGFDIGCGYIMKDTPTGLMLYSILKDGESHQMVVDLNYLDNAESVRHFVITSVSNYNGWWYNENKTDPNE